MSGESSKKLCKCAVFDDEEDEELWANEDGCDNNNDDVSANDADANANDDDDDDDDDGETDEDDEGKNWNESDTDDNTIGISDASCVNFGTSVEDDGFAFLAESLALSLLFAAISLFFSFSVNIFISSLRILKNPFFALTFSCWILVKW